MKLDQAKIQQALPIGEALVFDEIDSTNEYLLKHSQSLASGSICLAECQTAGRGRRGRAWFSPESQNLYFSMLWRFEPVDLAQLPPLSLMVSLIIAETLQEMGVQGVQIKWVNDVYLNGKKLAGILVETKTDKTGANVVIGIGINFAMKEVDPNVVTQPWADLSAYDFDRTELACRLAVALQKNLKIYPLVGFEHYAERWQAFDLFRHQPVKLITDQTEIHGISQGITPQGELILQQGEIIRTFGIGEISLRSNPL